MVLNLPACLDESSAFKFLVKLRDALSEAQSARALLIDFAPVRFAEPFGALLIGSGLTRFLCDLPGDVRLSDEGIDLSKPAHSYLAHVGFFDLLGLPAGKALGQAPGGTSYLPISELERDDLERESVRKGRPLPEIVQQHAEKFAVVLTQKHSLKTNRPLAYCLREIIRNVFEHAGTDLCLVSAQRWNDETVEMAILDEGRGIRASLAERHVFRDDLSALQAALRAGVSRAAIGAEDEFWANSGFGLYVLSELGRRLGSFTLCSGQAVVRTGSENGSGLLPCDFAGTAVRLRLKRPKGENLETLIQAIIREGESAADGDPKTAPRASRSTRAL